MKKSLHTAESKQKGDSAAEERNSKLYHLSAFVGKGATETIPGVHHIAWINVYSLPSGEGMPRITGTFEYATYHSTDHESDPDTLTTFPNVICFVFPENPKTRYTASFCAARELWGTGEQA